MSELSPVLWQRFFDNNGAPLAGGFLYSYAAGTTTPLATYTDETGVTPNSNPVVLDSSGYANVWMAEVAYKFVLADSSGGVLRTVDNVFSIQQQIATQLNLHGALAASANLSDVVSASASVKNLGIAPDSYPTEFTITSGQSASNLTGEAVDGATYTSVIYSYEIIQGTTIFANGYFAIQYLNSSWILLMGEAFNNGTYHGVTFSLSQAGSISQLKAAESGLGNGTIKLKKNYFLATP